MLTLVKDTFSGLDISYTGKYLATGMMLKVAVVDIANLTTRELSGHEDYVTAVAFASSSNKLATVAWDQSIRIWDCETGAEIKKFQLPSGYAKSVSFAQCDTEVLAGTESGKIYKYNIATGEYQILQAHDQEITRLAFHQGKLISIAKDGKLGIWDLKELKLLSFFQIHEGPALSIAFAKNKNCKNTSLANKKIACLCDSCQNKMICLTGGQDKLMKLWDLTTEKEILPALGHTNSISSFGISQNKAYLVSGSDDKTTRIWEIATGKQWLEISRDFEISAVAINPNATLFASAGYNMIWVYERSTGKLLYELTGHSDSVRWLQFGNDGQTLYSASLDGMIAKWNCSTGELLFSVETKDTIASAALLESENLIALGYWSGKVDLWNISTGQKAMSLPGYMLTVFSVQFVNSNLLSCCEDGNITLWNTQTGAKIQEFNVPNLKSILLLSDKQTIAVITESKIELWSLNGTKLTTIPQTNQPKVLATFPDEKAIFVGNSSGTIFQYQETR